MAEGRTESIDTRFNRIEQRLNRRNYAKQIMELEQKFDDKVTELETRVTRLDKDNLRLRRRIQTLEDTPPLHETMNHNPNRLSYIIRIGYHIFFGIFFRG